MGVNQKEVRALAEAEDFEWDGKIVANEIMILRAEGGSTTKTLVRETMRAFLKMAQETHKKIAAVRAKVEAPGYSGTPVDVKELEKLVLAEVQEIWGEDDPGGKMFAQMFASGKYIY